MSAATIALSSILFVACGGTSNTSSSTTKPNDAANSTSGSAASSTTAQATEDFIATAETFVNLKKWTKVRGFYLTNMSGHLEETLRIARADKGGIYPVGTNIQLIPNEAMVKRKKGFDPKSNDWEFFALTTSAEGTKIDKRGGSDVINFVGMSCASCHMKAKPEYDFVCEETHGCDPLPFKHDFFEALPNGDPRPK